MSVDKETAAKIANLSQLNLSEEELNKITRDMNRILEYMSLLNSVDTTGIEPLAHPVNNVSHLREDNVTAGVSREDALKNAPDKDDQHFRVPKVL